MPNEDIVIAGDLNLHMETEALYATKFKELMSLHDLKQHIVDPTHVKGHTLDVVITPNKEPFIGDIGVTELHLSHHFLINSSSKRTATDEIDNLPSFARCRHGQILQ